MRRVRYRDQVLEFPDGTTDQAITEYIASGAVSAAPQDTISASGPSDTGVATGAAANTVNAIGGVRGLAGAATLAGGVYGVRKLLQNRSNKPPSAPPPAPPTAGPPPAPKPSPSLHTLTAEDVAKIPEFANAKPGDVVRRALYEKYKFPAAQPAAAAKPAAKPATAAKPKRAQTPRENKEAAKKWMEEVAARTKKLPTATPAPGEPVREITIVEGGKEKKAAAPAKSRGKSGPELERRQKAIAGVRAAKAGTAKPAASVADDLTRQLEESLALERVLKQRGVPLVARTAPRGQVMQALGRVPGALGLILSILDASTIPQQVDQAQEFGRRAMRPDLERYVENDEGI